MRIREYQVRLEELMKEMTERMGQRITMTAISRATGISTSYLHDMKIGKANPALDKLGMLCAFFDCTLADLVEEVRAPEKGKISTRSKPLPGGIVKMGKIKRGGELRIGHTMFAGNTFDPIECQSGMWALMRSMVFSKLVSVEPDGIYNCLANNWIKLEELNYVFCIRDDVCFHDGNPLAVNDVIYSYQKWHQHHEHSPIRSIEVAQSSYGYAVKIALRKPGFPPRAFIVPENSAGELIGTGPFKVERMQDGLLELMANRGYFGDRPYLDRIVVQQYENQERLKEALERKEVNFAFGLYYPIRDCIAVNDVQEDACYHLIFNMGDAEIAEDANLRKAIYYGFNRVALAKVAGIDNPIFPAGPYSVALEDYSQEDRLYDFDKARGFLDKISFPKPLLIGSAEIKNSVARRNLIDAVVRNLNEIGIHTEMTFHRGGAHARVEIINCSDRWEHEVWRSDGRVNLARYRNSKVDSLAKQDAFGKLRREIEKDCPALPLFFASTPITYDKRLKAVNNQEIMARFLRNIPYWYFEKASIIDSQDASAC